MSECIIEQVYELLNNHYTVNKPYHEYEESTAFDTKLYIRRFREDYDFSKVVEYSLFEDVPIEIEYFHISKSFMTKYMILDKQSDNVLNQMKLILL
ncbi:MAG: hypothetical protein DRG78_00270 [Epsilonproteobacteria bacterium]|nr:MAG: hypothetical protein DRG78_00270 [Campylobacterota bacterium]